MSTAARGLSLLHDAGLSTSTSDGLNVCDDTIAFKAVQKRRWFPLFGGSKLHVAIIILIIPQ